MNATEWAQIASAGAALLATVGARFLISTWRNSVDSAEQRYRKTLTDVYYTYDPLPLRTPASGSQAESPIKERAPASSEDESRSRLAALPIDYHAQVLAQSRQTFILSMGAAVVGFLVIAVGVLLAFVGSTTTTVATMAGGVVAEAVAALFFSQSNRTRNTMAKQLEGFRESDEIARQSTERRALIDMIGDDAKRDDLIAKAVLALTDRGSTTTEH